MPAFQEVIQTATSEKIAGIPIWAVAAGGAVAVYAVSRVMGVGKSGVAPATPVTSTETPITPPSGEPMPIEPVDLSGIESGIAGLSGDLSGLTGNVDALRQDFSGMGSDLNARIGDVLGQLSTSDEATRRSFLDVTGGLSQAQEGIAGLQGGISGLYPQFGTVLAGQAQGFQSLEQRLQESLSGQAGARGDILAAQAQGFQQAAQAAQGQSAQIAAVDQKIEVLKAQETKRDERDAAQHQQTMDMLRTILTAVRTGFRQAA